MFITSPKRKNGSTVIRLVESFRKEGKVKTRIVKTIGQSKDIEVIKYYKKTAQKLLDEHKKGLIQLSDQAWKMPIDLNRFLGQDRYNNGFEDILGSSYKQLGFESLLKRQRGNKVLNEILKFLVLVRAFSPASKLKSCYVLKEHFNKVFSHRQVLNMMDCLSKQEEFIKTHIFRSAMGEKRELDVLLFDVTTLYFESVSSDDLRGFGYSKDGKFNEVQVVLAVLANKEGLALTYELFSGQTAETKTLRKVLSAFLKKYCVKSLQVVADRGMFSQSNFDFFKDLSQKGIEAKYVVSCPLRKLPKKLQEKVLDLSHYKKRGSFSFYEMMHKGRRVVVVYSQELKARDEKKRQRLLDKLKDLAPDGEVSASRLVRSGGVRKFMETVKGRVSVDRKKIERDARWDGLCGVCTNVEGAKPEELMTTYRRLWRIEEVFRINKHTLKMRPIYHRLARRIRAHILLCFLSYTLLRWTQMKLARKGLCFSSEELISILHGVESFVIKDKIKKKGGEVYCVPRELTKRAQKIYEAFGKSFPTRPYLLK